jgi:predicted short-subunit dehydrogenase-like oxidoreductase (DUF2520 family)
LQACEFIGAGTVYDQLEQLPEPELWLIVTPDSAISNVAQQLSTLPNLPSNATIFHCSGSLTSTALISLAIASRSLASIHPVHSFASPLRSQDSFTIFARKDGKIINISDSTGIMAPLTMRGSHAK